MGVPFPLAHESGQGAGQESGVPRTPLNSLQEEEEEQTPGVTLPLGTSKKHVDGGGYLPSETGAFGPPGVPESNRFLNQIKC